FADLRSNLQDPSKVRTGRHGMVTGGIVEPDDLASGLPHAHQPVESIEFCKNRVESVGGGRLVGGPRAQAQLRSHRDAGALHQKWRSSTTFVETRAAADDERNRACEPHQAADSTRMCPCG